MVASNAVQNSQSEGRWEQDKQGVEIVADSVFPQEILKHQMALAGANFKYHSRTSHCPHPVAPVSNIYHNIKNTWRDRKKSILKIRAVAGVSTAVLGFSTISYLAFNFDKNNLGWGGKKTRDVSVSNVPGARTALDYKLE